MHTTFMTPRGYSFMMESLPPSDKSTVNSDKVGSRHLRLGQAPVMRCRFLIPVIPVYSTDS